MSVAAERSHSPTHFGSKRLFEHSESSPDFQQQQRPHSSVKRARRRASGSPGRREGLQQREAGTLRASYLAALRGLFPSMEEKVLSDVLDSCGNNIDAAIKRLGELQLTAQCSAAAHPSVAQLRGEEAGQAHSGTGSPKGADAASSGHRTPPEQAQQSGAEAGAPGGVPSTSAEWVEALVQQMAGASDVGEARVRAAEVLCAFEQAVLRKAGGELQRDGGGDVESAALRAQLSELARDNGILKRAVAIQNARLQEAVGARDAEVAAMRGALQQYEAKIRALELSNYSLSLHLRQATGPPGSHGGLGPLDRRPPDVY